MAEVFEGLKVVDFTEGMLGAVTTMVLSDFGATWSRWNRPGGHRSRSILRPSSGTAARGAWCWTWRIRKTRRRRDGCRFSRTWSSRASRPAQRPAWASTTRRSAPSADLVYASLTGWDPRALRPLQALRRSCRSKDRQDDGLLRAGQPAGAALLRGADRNSRRQHGRSARHHRRAPRAETRRGRARRWKPA